MTGSEIFLINLTNRRIPANPNYHMSIKKTQAILKCFIHLKSSAWFTLRQIFQEILNILFECSLLEFEYSFPIHNYWSRVPEPASRRSFLGGSARAWQSREWRRSSSPDRRPSRCHIFAVTRKKERLIAGYAWRSLIDNQL